MPSCLAADTTTSAAGARHDPESVRTVLIRSPHARGLLVLWRAVGPAIPRIAMLAFSVDDEENFSSRTQGGWDNEGVVLQE